MDEPGEAAELADIASAILRKCKTAKQTPEALFGSVIRTAIDEVVDGPRTGRWSLDQLSSPEKTYVGTKVEIITKTALELERSVEQDAVIGKHHVNIKWSKSSAWMIARENVGAYCLGLGTDQKGLKFSVGVFKAVESRLNPGQNQDKKRTLSAESFAHDIRWIVRDADLPPNFVERLSPDVRTEIFSEQTAQARLRALARLAPGVPIPREAICTVAMDKDDPLRRVRKDKARTDPLGGMLMLSTKYGKAELTRRGYTNLPANHFIAVPVAFDR